MLSAPDAPVPMAMARIAITASSGLMVTGAATRPTKAVNTTSDMTRGFRAKKCLQWLPTCESPLRQSLGRRLGHAYLSPSFCY
jgi:hypothetical protein